jgi:membrane associated rhomboid family serine protease
MLLPISDSNPRHKISFQFVTVGLIAVCTAVFIWQVTLDPRASQEAVFALGTIPAVVFGTRELAPELTWVPAELTLITSMFMHGGWMHLIGNMLYLWILGDNVEDCMGHVRFLIFYLVCGVAAVFTHMMIDPASTVPLVGASGAISGVMGAYLLLHPKAHINILIWIFIFVKIVPVPAWIALAFWIALQFVNATMTPSTGGGVAFWAHIGGAAAGMVLVPFFKRRNVPLLAGVGGRPLNPVEPWGEDEPRRGPWSRTASRQNKPKIRMRRPGRGGVRRPWQ